MTTYKTIDPRDAGIQQAAQFVDKHFAEQRKEHPFTGESANQDNHRLKLLPFTTKTGKKGYTVIKEVLVGYVYENE